MVWDGVVEGVVFFVDVVYVKVVDLDLDVEVGVVCVCEFGGVEGDNIDVGDFWGGVYVVG